MTIDYKKVAELLRIHGRGGDFEAAQQAAIALCERMASGELVERTDDNAAVEFFERNGFAPPADLDFYEPSARAQAMLERGQVAADAEVKRHLEAGREVYGRRDGEPVVIKPPADIEREYCRACVRVLFNHEQPESSVRFVDVQDLLIRERAAARQEGFESGFRAGLREGKPGQ